MVRGKVYFSGTLITSIFNFLLIIVLGTHDEDVNTRHDPDAYPHKHAHSRAGEVQMPPVGTGTDPGVAHAV